MTTAKPIDPELQAVQNAAWDLKDLTDDIAWRKLSERDKAMLQSVERDLRRLIAKVDTIQHKRKRATVDDEATNDNAQPTLALGAGAE